MLEDNKYKIEDKGNFSGESDEPTKASKFFLNLTVNSQALNWSVILYSIHIFYTILFYLILNKNQIFKGKSKEFCWTGKQR